MLNPLKKTSLLVKSDFFLVKSCIFSTFNLKKKDGYHSCLRCLYSHFYLVLFHTSIFRRGPSLRAQVCCLGHGRLQLRKLLSSRKVCSVQKMGKVPTKTLGELWKMTILLWKMTILIHFAMGFYCKPLVT